MRKKILVVCMIVISFAASAKTNTGDKDRKPDFRDVISTYIDSYVTGNYKQLDKVLSDDATIRIPRGEVVLVHSKDKLIKQLKFEGGINQNCTSEYHLMDKSDAMIMAKVDFVYAGFTQHNYVTLERNENKEWKITQVCRFFEDDNHNSGPVDRVTASK